MYKSIILSALAMSMSFNVLALQDSSDDVIKKEEKIELKYENLKLGDVKYFKVIGDFGKIKPERESNLSNIGKDFLQSSLNHYSDILQKSGALTEEDKKDIRKMELEIKVLDIKNNIYNENKKFLFINTTTEELKTECFYKKYNTFKTCFEYGFGKVFSIRNTERKDSEKLASKEVEAIEEKLKENGYVKEKGSFVKGDNKVEINLNKNDIETYVTKKSLIKAKSSYLKKIRDLSLENSINSHLEYLD